ncbi:Aldo-keto reductase [Mycena kentingensis (nom. inval.)]|nr:Aldo-keto reductase [Mycena kentingensis (nom. inval.)]
MSLPTRNIGGFPVSEIGFGLMGKSLTPATDVSADRSCRHRGASLRRGWTGRGALQGLGCGIRRWRPPLGRSARLRSWATLRSSSESGSSAPASGAKFSLATKGGASRTTGINGSREFIREQLQTSLTRLGVDYIDLYYIHRVDPKTPIEVTINALKELVQEGKIKAIGISECSAKTLRRAHAVHPIAALQIEYSPFVLDIEQPEVGLFDACRELGITIVAYSPLGRGLLTGRFKSPDDFAPNDFRRNIPRYSKKNFPKILALVANIEKIGKKQGKIHVALAWVLAQGKQFVVIPGTKKVEYLKENLGGASSALQLTTEEIAEIRGAAEASLEDIKGSRYPEIHMAGLLQDTPELSQ